MRRGGAIALHHRIDHAGATGYRVQLVPEPKLS
jgi:hypothetical protein